MPTEVFLKQKSDEIENLLEVIASKVQTSNHKFLDISGELESIKLIFSDIEKELNKSAGDGQSERASLLTATTKTIKLFQKGQDNISTFSNDYSDQIYHELNQHIRSYNIIKNQIEQYKKNGKKSESFSGALISYTFYDAMDEGFSVGDASKEEAGAYAAYLNLLHDEHARNTFTFLQRIQLVATATELVSYFIGYQSAAFFNKLSHEGAHLLPFLPYEWLAVAGGEGLNAFLNGHFFGVFAKDLGYDLQVLFKTDSPELTLLGNLAPSLQDKFKRGVNAIGKFSFVAGLSGASVVPFSAADWQVFQSIYHVAIVSAAYEGLHWSGAEALRQFLLKIASPFGALYRCFCESDDASTKRQTAQIAQKVKTALVQNFKSGTSRFLQNKIDIKPELLQKIFDLMLQKDKNTKDTERLILLIHSLAQPSEKSYKLNNIARFLIQLLGEFGIALTLLGYIGESDKTVAQLDDRSDRSPLNIALSAGIVTPAFMGLYMLIIWKIVADIHDATLGVPIKYGCNEWQNTKTWSEFLSSMTWGVGKSLWDSVSSYFTRMGETWGKRDSFLDFLSQQGGTAKTLLLIPLALLGWGSSASVMELNRENLDGLSQSIFGNADSLYELTVPFALITATLVNVYAVIPVLSAVWNRLMRITACTKNKEAEFLFSDFTKFNLELMNKTDAAMIVRILFDMIKKVNDPNIAEKIISGFFVGLTAEDVFGAKFVKGSSGTVGGIIKKVSSKDEADGDDGENSFGNKDEEDGIGVSKRVFPIKYPFCNALEKLHGQLEYLRFFQPPPTEKQNPSRSLLHHTL